MGEQRAGVAGKGQIQHREVGSLREFHTANLRNPHAASQATVLAIEILQAYLSMGIEPWAIHADCQASKEKHSTSESASVAVSVDR